MDFLLCLAPDLGVVSLGTCTSLLFGSGMRVAAVLGEVGMGIRMVARACAASERAEIIATQRYRLGGVGPASPPLSPSCNQAGPTRKYEWWSRGTRKRSGSRFEGGDDEEGSRMRGKDMAASIAGTETSLEMGTLSSSLTGRPSHASPADVPNASARTEVTSKIHNLAMTRKSHQKPAGQQTSNRKVARPPAHDRPRPTAEW
mmetsp:Transcript_6812/g.11475  ORF Transcript_6812/g.11475 Transcript_6812/m.11475 type:complete len:202 (-) Transcript_6812:641-1246(-)